MFLKSKFLEFGVFALLFVAGGYWAAATQSSPRSHHGVTHQGATHAALAIAADESAPSVQLHAIKDPVAGWNLHIVTDNFRFAPERAGQPHVLGEGHAHLFVDKVKIARVYGSWFHLAKLPPGEHRLKVTLNTNDHKNYVVGDQAIGDEIILSFDDS